MNPLIVIPAYNSNNTINILIKKITDQTDVKILVIDDGSINKINIENKNAAILIRNNKNKGKGGVLKKAIKYALNNNYSHILSIDSDLQHDPKHINSFLKIDKDVDIVFGARELSHPMPFHRVLSNKITSYIISCLVKQEIKDSQSGYRRYKLSIFKDKKLNENGFHFESELILKCIKRNTKIEHIPIATIYNNSISSIDNFLDTLKFIKLILKHCFVK
tara:strand:+ start:383 stop:1039 length:657 start_codon:yes stop_codon:yes gene_type:complete